MPLYEYQCRDCGHQFEIQQSLSDDALSECPACAGALRKVFSPVGIAFKGSGFYKTDSRSSGSSGAGSSSSGSDGKDGSDASSGGSDAASSGSDTSGGSGSTTTSGGDTATSTASASSS